MIIVDTTILVYAAGELHPLRDPCRRLFDAVVAGSVAVTTSAAVIQEFAHVFARRRDRETAAQEAHRFALLLAPLLAVTEDHVEPALELFRAQTELGAFDAFLAAAAREAGARALVSAGRAFAGVEGLRYVDPATAELDELLRA